MALRTAYRPQAESGSSQLYWLSSTVEVQARGHFMNSVKLDKRLDNINDGY